MANGYNQNTVRRKDHGPSLAGGLSPGGSMRKGSRRYASGVWDGGRHRVVFGTLAAVEHVLGA